MPRHRATIADAAEALLRSDGLVIPSAESRPALAPWWHPHRYLAAALAAIQQATTGGPSGNRAAVLGAAAGQLLGVAAELWWPMHLQCELEVSPDEMPWELLNGTGFETDKHWLTTPVAMAVHELSSDVTALSVWALELERAGEERLSYREAEVHADHATGLAVVAATLAIRAGMDKVPAG